jgi:hypothetical protein
MAKEEEKKQEEEVKQELSKRDAFRKRFAESNPDLNMDDEDAYYDAAGRMMDDYEGLRDRSNRLRENIGKSPAFQDMVLAARSQENFDPVIWMVKTGQLDLDALKDDPDYLDKLTAARTEYLDNLASGKKLKEEQKANMPGSIEAITAKAEEMGLDAEQTKEVIGKVFALSDEITRGKIPVDVFVLLAKGANYDQAVEDAHDEGVAEGLNQKVDDKLRHMAAPAAPAGSQKPVPEPKPKKKEIKNPFLA